MDKDIFYKLWDITAEKEIKKPLDSCLHRVEIKENYRNFRDTVYSRYGNELRRFRRMVCTREDDKLDRYKIAALFYVAFVNNTDGHSFSVFGSNNKRLSEAEVSITHETAFNISCGILEALIIYDNEIDKGYRKYVEENGILEQEMICFDNSNSKTSYKEEILKQLICAQKENRLSVAHLAFTFFSLENNTSLCYYKVTQTSC
jgi:hypothetical protein